MSVKKIGKKISVSVTREDIEKGERCNSRLCPVARALFRAGVRRVNVDVDLIKGQIDGRPFSIRSPKVARCFIRLFDAVGMNTTCTPIRFSFTA